MHATMPTHEVAGRRYMSAVWQRGCLSWRSLVAWSALPFTLRTSLIALGGV